MVAVPLPAGLEEHQSELWVTLHGLELVDALKQPGHYHPARLEAASEDNYGELVLTIVRGPHAVVQRASRIRGLMHLEKADSIGTRIGEPRCLRTASFASSSARSLIIIYPKRMLQVQ